jgi:hypothetical protein
MGYGREGERGGRSGASMTMVGDEQVGITKELRATVHSGAAHTLYYWAITVILIF